MYEKKLARSATDKYLMGVCGGVAAYIGIDPTVVRLIWAGGTLITGGAGILLYIVACVLMPAEEEG